jgi:ribosomal-protein-alanine N-acetyltransferase
MSKTINIGLGVFSKNKIIFNGVDCIKGNKPLKPAIRYFEINDLNGIMGIERQSFKNPWSSNMFEALHQITPEGFYVAVIDEAIIGYAIVLTEQSWRHWSRKRTVHLLNLAVHPHFRKKGIGKHLFNRVITDIERIDAEEIYLEVRASNTNAIAFYKKLGFSRIGLINRFYGDEDAIVMAKRI